MKYLFLSVLFSSALISACANSPKGIASKEYAADCARAERAENFLLAEQLCSIALTENDDVGSNNLKIKSQRLYDLGRIKQRLAKFSESELLIKESLKIEEMLDTPLKTTGSRIVDLSISLAGQDKWHEGIPLLERILPVAPQFSRQERARVSHLLMQYSNHLKLLNQLALAKRFKSTSTLIADNDTVTFRQQ